MIQLCYFDIFQLLALGSVWTKTAISTQADSDVVDHSTTRGEVSVILFIFKLFKKYLE